jgi:hypothetical protein
MWQYKAQCIYIFVGISLIGRAHLSYGMAQKAAKIKQQLTASIKELKEKPQDAARICKALCNREAVAINAQIVCGLCYAHCKPGPKTSRSKAVIPGLMINACNKKNYNTEQQRVNAVAQAVSCKDKIEAQQTKYHILDVKCKQLQQAAELLQNRSEAQLTDQQAAIQEVVNLQNQIMGLQKMINNHQQSCQKSLQEQASKYEKEYELINASNQKLNNTIQQLNQELSELKNVPQSKGAQVTMPSESEYGYVPYPAPEGKQWIWKGMPNESGSITYIPQLINQKVERPRQTQAMSPKPFIYPPKTYSSVQPSKLINNESIIASPSISTVEAIPSLEQVPLPEKNMWQQFLDRLNMNNYEIYEPYGFSALGS